ncbi:MAG: hypothetical protein PUC41_05295 [Oscillospiraceae bacterium]|nr:hypothetical protein [Oscillospiraceae bacterium]
MSDEKSYTLKSARSELAKFKRRIETKKASIERLKAEIRQDTAKVKQLTAICELLHQEAVQQKLSVILFRKNFTPEQIDKLVELTVRMSDSIDDISIDRLNALLQTETE